MKTRTLLLLLFILAVLAGAGAFLIRVKNPGRTQKDLGTPLLEQLPVDRVMFITLKGPDGEVSLERDNDKWVVENRFRYPADFPKIADLVRKLKAAKVGRRFEASEETLKRLSLKEPDDTEALEAEKGRLVYLKDGKGTVLAAVLLGRPRKAGEEGRTMGGHYVRVNRDSTVFLVDQEFSSLSVDPVAWLDKDLVKVEASEVRKILCLEPDGKALRYSFERPEKGKDLKPVDLPAKGNIKTSTLNRLARALSSLRMEDVINPSAPSASADTEIGSRLEYQLFNGMIYRVYLGKKCPEGGSCILKLEVAYKAPVPEKKETASQKTPEELALEAKQENDRLSPWVYVIPKWQQEAFVTDPQGLVEKPDKESKRSKSKGPRPK
jgi:hypothetical protein